MKQSIENGVYLTGLCVGWVITNITMNTVIGIITICGGALYAINQFTILVKTIKNRKKK